MRAVAKRRAGNVSFAAAGSVILPQTRWGVQSFPILSGYLTDRPVARGAVAYRQCLKSTVRANINLLHCPYIADLMIDLVFCGKGPFTKLREGAASEFAF